MPRKTRERRSNWRTEEVHNIGSGKRISFIWGGSAFWGTGLECGAVHKGCSSWSLYDEKKKKSYYSDITGLFFQDGRYNRIQQIRICAIEVRGEWNCSLPSTSNYWWSLSPTIFHLLSLLQLVAPFSCSLDASPCMPAAVLCNHTFQNTVL